MRAFIHLAAALVTTGSLTAGVIYVGPEGKAGNPGTEAAPLGTIQAGLDRCGPGDQCVVLPGVYRETVRVSRSGTADQPVLLTARGDVTLDGTDPVAGVWEQHEGDIHRIALPGPAVEQVFLDGRPLSLARWPNARFEETWIRSKWARAAKGSRKDLMVCDALAETGIDWTGAIAVLNVGHQYKTWTRRILSHGKGERSFTYELVERLGDGKDEGRTWWDDRFYITGTPKALDAPGEWFHDAEEGFLYLVVNGERTPAPGTLHVKRRNHGITGEGVSDVRVSGFRFFACTARFTGAERMTIENCDIRFPSCSTMIGETMPPGERFNTPVTGVSGKDNVLKGLYVAYASGSGIRVSGSGNRVEDCIVHDACWSGTINFAGIAVVPHGQAEARSTVSRCTVYNVGNIGISYRGRNNVIEYNHVHHTGLACHDIAAIHTGSPATAGSVAHHNWVHHSAGKAMRGDDQTRELTVHHNLVWNCDEGIIVKGDRNKVYHNTILGKDGHGALLIPTRQEPKKWWTKHEILAVQNEHSLFLNNYCESVSYRHKPIPQNKGISSNVAYAGQIPFADVLLRVGPRALEAGKPDARPRDGAHIVDTGKLVEGLNDDFVGNAPDIGAYESGQPAWTPGARRSHPDDIVLPIEAETARTWQLAGRLTGKPGASLPLPNDLENSPLSLAARKTLRTIYDECWTADEISKRRDAIQKRSEHEENSPEYKRHHAVVADLHKKARKRLIDRARKALSDADLKQLNTIMNP